MNPRFVPTTSLVAVLALAGCTQVYSPLTVHLPMRDGSQNSVCNRLATQSPVTPTASRDAAPDATGGTIAPGLYRLTAFTMHVPDENVTDWPPRAITIDVRGDQWQLSSTRTGAQPTTATWRVETQGTNLTLERSCGSWDPVVMGFDATTDQLRVHVEVPHGRGIWVLSRVGD